MSAIAAWLRGQLELPGHGAQRIAAMEGLRGIAVTLVFLQHFGVQAILLIALDPTALALATWMRGTGNLGVELFFILSGYLIYGTLLRRRPAFLPFMARRAERIYPAFLVVFALLLAAHLLLGTGLVPDDPLSAATLILANLALLPGVLRIDRVVDVAWSLSYEMAFYLLLGLAVPALRLWRWPPAARVAWILALAGLAALICHLFPRGVGLLAPPLSVLPLAAGMLLFELDTARGRVPPTPIAALAFTLAILVAANVHASPLAIEAMETLALALFCATALRAETRVARVLAWSPLRWLGNISYSFYLVHGLVVLAVFRAMGTFGGYDWPAATFWLLLPPLFAAAAVASFVLFAAVERPWSLQPRRTPALP